MWVSYVQIYVQLSESGEQCGMFLFLCVYKETVLFACGQFVSMTLILIFNICGSVHHAL